MPLESPWWTQAPIARWNRHAARARPSERGAALRSSSDASRLFFFFSASHHQLLFFSLSLSLPLQKPPLDNSRPRSSSPRRLRRLPLPTLPRERRRYGSGSSRFWSRNSKRRRRQRSSLGDRVGPLLVCSSRRSPLRVAFHGQPARVMPRYEIGLSPERSKETPRREIRAAGGDERIRSMAAAAAAKLSLSFFAHHFFPSLFSLSFLNPPLHPHRNGPRER